MKLVNFQSENLVVDYISFNITGCQNQLQLIYLIHLVLTQL